MVDKVIAIEQARSLEPWQQLDTPDRLMHTEPAPGEIVSERYHEDLAAYEVVLSNGMRVCWKETNFMEDEVMVSGTAAGGLSEVRLRLGESLVSTTILWDSAVYCWCFI